MRREQACKRERDRDAGGVVDRAFAMRMAVDMRADHDPIRASARQVGNQHARPRGMIIAVDDHAGGRERAVRRTAQRLRRFGTDAERRDAGAAVASTRPRYGADAGFRMRDQKPDRAHLLRQPELDAAVHVPGRERIFVADHDDAAADAVRVPLEILSVGPSRDRGLPPLAPAADAVPRSGVHWNETPVVASVSCAVRHRQPG